MNINCDGKSDGRMKFFNGRRERREQEGHVG